MSQIARMEGRLAPELSDPLIDRHRPFSFTLDGRRIDAFAGDTVLSALLANGIDTLGSHRRHPLALDETTAPPIAVRGNEHRLDLAMPMPLCPALADVDLVTLGARRTRSLLQRLTGLFMGRPASLDHAVAAGLNLPGTWIDTAPEHRLSADYVIVGGGVAGMTAALRAARTKASVVLVEREPVLGGMSVMYGKADGEPAPQDAIARLAGDIANERSITVLTGTEAFDITSGTVEAVRVATADGIPRPERLSISGSHIVLATGLVEKLPILPGNRLPGVALSSFAWRMAARFNVWPGTSTHIHTVSNVAYRLALLGGDSGKTVVRASDSRSAPQTRFIEFCKAYGFRLSWGTVIDHVRREGRSLAVSLADAERGAPQPDPSRAERLVVSGGWQPDLELWLRAGGSLAHDPDAHALRPIGEPGPVLVGAAAGIQSLRGCQASAEAAIARLAGRRKVDVADPVIDPVFETPDGPPFVSAPRQRGMAPAYRAAGRTLSNLPQPERSGWRSLLAPSNSRARGDDPTPMGVMDVAGSIDSGAIPPQDAPNVCAERCVLPRRLSAPIPSGPDAGLPDPGIPFYLSARFGRDQIVRALDFAQGVRHGTGCLIFANTDDTDPEHAIGVVIAVEETGRCRALTAWPENRTVYVRDGLACSPARLGAAIQK